MRFLYSLLLSTILFLMAGCSAPPIATPVAPSPQGTVDKYPAGSLVTGLNPVAVGRQILETNGGARFLESPIPVLVQQMSYSDAHQYIPTLDEAQDQLWSPDRSVWLVIFRARWELMPMGPPGATLQPNTFDGCLLVLFTADDGRLIAMGDSRCPGQN